MTSITSEAHFRQRVIRYSEKHGVTAASIRHHRSRNAIYEWKSKYDGNWKSLRDKSHRPKSHPKQHTEEEKELILRHWRRHKDDRIVLWDTIRKKGYKRSYYSMTRVLGKWLSDEEKTKIKARKPKPYMRVCEQNIRDKKSRLMLSSCPAGVLQTGENTTNTRRLTSVQG